MKILKPWQKAVFILAGIMFFFLGFTSLPQVFVSTREYQKITAVISNIEKDYHFSSDGDRETEYTAYVSYKFDGTEYSNVKLGACSSFTSVGNREEIFVNRNNPRKILSTNPLRYMLLLFPFIGLAFILIPIYPAMKENLWGRRFREKHRPVYAKIDCVDRNTSIAVGNKCPFKIIVTYRNASDGKIYKFKSENIWDDPSGIIETRGITELPVHVDWNNPKLYLVDTRVIFGNTVI